MKEKRAQKKKEKKNELLFFFLYSKDWNVISCAHGTHTAFLGLLALDIVATFFLFVCF